MKQPCPKDCPRRAAGCGITCPDWQAYVNERNAGYEAKQHNHDYACCKRVVIDRAVHTMHRKRRK